MEPSSGFTGMSDSFDQSLQAALDASNLRILPAETINGLVANATRFRISAGSIHRREGDQNAIHLELVLSGLLRAYVTALDGRTLTFRYVRAGSIMGAATLFLDSFSMPATIQAVTDALIIGFPPESVRQAADSDTRVARALLNEMSERVMSFIVEIPGSAFTTVRQRAARHLLDLASAGRPGPALIASVSQQELANAAGTVREVIVRVLRDFRDEGLIETGREGIRLLDPERLSAEVYRAPGTKVPDPRDPDR